MANTLTFELIRGIWLMQSASLEVYAEAAMNYLSGREIPTGFFSSLKLPDVPKNIALIPVAGALTKSDVCGWQGTRTLSGLVNAAAADKSKEAIIMMYENCPGGQVDGSQEFAESVINAKKRKPVVGAVSGSNGSAGVLNMAHCTESFAMAETDLIGCIGVLGRIKNPAKADAENKDYIEVISDFSPDKNAEAKSVDVYKEQIINPMAKIFHNNVIAGRGDRLKLEKENVLSGKMYIAEKAVEFGLIDGIMPFDKIVKRSIMLAKTIK